jgi:hypothetical protein
MKFGNLMRHSQLTKITTFFSFIALVGTSCVSVSLGPKPGEQSKGVQFASPPPPYEPLEQSRADGAWQNTKNGNSISFFSTCNDPAEPPLEFLSKELFSELGEMKMLRQRLITFNGREALEQEVEGKVDGVLTRIHAVLFKKNGCTYTLSFIGVPNAYENDRAVYAGFLQRFHAP